MIKAMREQVRDAEERLRKLGWIAVKETIEYYLERGDVQMCATMLAVAGSQLPVEAQLENRVTGTYVDLLSRLRLHTSAAYLRKNTRCEDIQAMAHVDTINFVSCGRCEEPILTPKPTSSRQTSRIVEPIGLLKGGFGVCHECSYPGARCSIWCVDVQLPYGSSVNQIPGNW
jgi:hypothetical protein